MSLQSLTDWCDPDLAAHELAIDTGALPANVSFLEAKQVYTVNNPLGTALYRMLQELVNAGVLKYDEEEVKYRWNPEFDWKNA